MLNYKQIWHGIKPIRWLNKFNLTQLDELQKQVGLPPQYAQKIIKSITTMKMAAAIETAVGQGRLTIKQIRELKRSRC